MASNYNFFGQNVSEEMQERQAERVKQSQKLLKELYHEELNPKYSTPTIRGLKIIILTSLVCMMLFSSVVTVKYNNFITMQEEVFAKTSMLEAALQRRYNLFGNLAQLTMNHAVLEDQVFTHVADVRKEFVDKLNLNDDQKQQVLDNKSDAKSGNAISHVISAMAASGESPIGQMLAVAEQYPDIKSAETYLHMMVQMVEIEDRITLRRVDLLTKIQLFNTEIARFPWYYLAKFTRFHRIDYFEAENGSHSRPVMTLDSFELLMPLKLNSSAELHK
jgi:LemA protein